MSEPNNPVTIYVTLTSREAQLLSDFTRKIGIDECRKASADTNTAVDLLYAMCRMGEAFARAGCKSPSRSRS